MRTTFLILIPLLLLGVAACHPDSHIQKTQGFYNAFNSRDFKPISQYISDTMLITEGGISTPYSIDAYYEFFQWDSVFAPTYQVIEISQTDSFAFVTLSVISKRLEFLRNNPLVTKQRLHFKGSRITQIEILDYVDADWDIWISTRDSLEVWIDSHHPDLTGFVYDMTPKGAANYMKAIELYRLSHPTH